MQSKYSNSGDPYGKGRTGVSGMDNRGGGTHGKGGRVVNGIAMGSMDGKGSGTRPKLGDAVYESAEYSSGPHCK